MIENEVIVAEPTAELSDAEMAEIDEEVARILPADLEDARSRFSSEAYQLSQRLGAPDNDTDPDAARKLEHSILLKRYEQDAIAKRIEETRPIRRSDQGLAQFEERIDLPSDSFSATTETAPLEKSKKDSILSPERQAQVDKIDSEISQLVDRAEVLMEENKEMEKWLAGQLEEVRLRGERLRAVIELRKKE